MVGGSRGEWICIEYWIEFGSVEELLTAQLRCTAQAKSDVPATLLEVASSKPSMFRASGCDSERLRSRHELDPAQTHIQSLLSVM